MRKSIMASIILFESEESRGKNIAEFTQAVPHLYRARNDERSNRSWTRAVRFRAGYASAGDRPSSRRAVRIWYISACRARGVPPHLR